MHIRTVLDGREANICLANENERTFRKHLGQPGDILEIDPFTDQTEKPDNGFANMLEVRLRLSAHNSLLEMVKVDAMRQMQHRERGQTFLAQFLAGDHQGVNFSKES